MELNYQHHADGENGDQEGRHEKSRGFLLLLGRASECIGDIRGKGIRLYFLLETGSHVGVSSYPGFYLGPRGQDPFPVKMFDRDRPGNEFGRGHGRNRHRPSPHSGNGNIFQLPGGRAVPLGHAEQDVLLVVTVAEGAGADPTHGQLQEAGHHIMVKPEHPGPRPVYPPFKRWLSRGRVIRGLGHPFGTGITMA